MLQNKQREMRASRKHFDSHPVFLFRISTILSRLLYQLRPIGQGKKKGIHRIFGHRPPSPLPLSLLNKNDPIDKQIIRLVRCGILRIKTIRINGGE